MHKGTAAHEEAPAYVARRLAAPALAQLVSAFAEGTADRRLATALTALAADPQDPPRLAETGQLLSQLDVFTDRWDTRRGAERQQAGTLDLPPDRAALALDAATALGLRGGTRPRLRTYDHVLVLGGTLWGCLVRTGEAARLVTGGQVSTATVTALGGHRPFLPEESVQAAAVGHPGLGEEFQALDACARDAFDLGEPEAVEGEASDAVGATWGVHTYCAATGLTVRVAAAPSRTPGRRADTADTYAFFADRRGPLGGIADGARLLLVTSAINVPAQHATALRMLALPYGARVDTVGHTAEAVPPALHRSPSVTEYLLEIRSMVRALRRLHEAAGR